MPGVKRNSLRGRLARTIAGMGTAIHTGITGVAMSLGGVSPGRGGYQAGRRDSRRTRGWRPGEGSAAADILPDLSVLRGRSRDLERNHPLAAGAIATKSNGVVGTGLVLRSVLDADVLGLTPKRATELQYQLEYEWEIFERECDWTGLQHFRDMQRLIYRSSRVSGDVGIARRWRKRPGETYGTRLVLIEADRISNPHRRADTPLLQGGVQLAESGEVLGYHVSDRHPGDILGGALNWQYVPRRGTGTGMVQMIVAAQLQRPGQVRGVPLFAPIEEQLKQLGDYTDAEVKAAVNDAYLFAFEELAPIDDDGDPLITNPEGKQDDAGELTLEDLTVTTLGAGSKVTVKKPERPNAAFGDFVKAFCQYIGAALSLPYEVLLMHFGSSFSASRGALEVAWKADQVDQAWLIRTVLDVVREWQFTEMVAAGRFDAPGFFDDPIRRAAWLDRVWVGPTRIQINPQVESNADKTDIEMKVKTREQVMTERTGGDFDTKARQILLEQQTLGETPQSSGAPQRNDERNNDGTDEARG